MTAVIRVGAAILETVIEADLPDDGSRRRPRNLRPAPLEISGQGSKAVQDLDQPTSHQRRTA